MLRSLLLCQMAVHADQAAELRATVDGLTGQMDSDSLLERELAETSATRVMVASLEARVALRRLDEGSYGICEICTEAHPVRATGGHPPRAPLRQLPRLLRPAFAAEQRQRQTR